MADLVFNIAKGAFVEKIRDGASNLGILLLKAADTDDAMRDCESVSALLSTDAQEADDASYARKTGLTGTITVDHTNNRVDADLPDQTFSALEGDAIVDAVVFYEEDTDDGDRIPLTLHDFAITPDGSDVELVFNAAGFARAS